jgi:hypothetical protein
MRGSAEYLARAGVLCALVRLSFHQAIPELILSAALRLIARYQQGWSTLGQTSIFLADRRSAGN